MLPCRCCCLEGFTLTCNTAFLPYPRRRPLFSHNNGKIWKLNIGVHHSFHSYAGREWLSVCKYWIMYKGPPWKSASVCQPFREPRLLQTIGCTHYIYTKFLRAPTWVWDHLLHLFLTVLYNHFKGTIVDVPSPLANPFMDLLSTSPENRLVIQPSANYFLHFLPTISNTYLLETVSFIHLLQTISCTHLLHTISCKLLL